MSTTKIIIQDFIILIAASSAPFRVYTDADDINYLIPHQISNNILKKITRIINVDLKKVFTNFWKFGNAAALIIPITLDATNGRVVKSGN